MSLALTRRGARSAARRAVATGGAKVAIPGTGRTYFGAWIDTISGLSGESGIESRETDLGRTYDMHLTYYGWGDDFNFAAGSQMQLDVAHGRIPQLSWGYGTLTLSTVNAGTDDAYIAAQAVKCRNFGHPMFLRFGIEMNAYVGAGYEVQPAAFVTAWQRVRGIFDANGATNVSWVWCPNIDSKGGTTYDDYYPGSAYVDWIGVDGYHSSTTGDPDRTFATIFVPFFTYANTKSKPIMIGEFASDNSFGNKAAWIADMGAWVEANADTYNLKALCWFDTDKSTTSIDYTADNPAAAYTEWLNAMKRTIFGGPGYTPPATSAYESAVLADTPTAFWRMNEGTGLTAVDSSGNGHTGTLSGPPAINQASHAGLGTCYTFAASPNTTHITADTLGSFGSAMSAGFSVEFWIKSTDATAATCALGFLNTGSTTALAVYLNTSHGLGGLAAHTTFWARSETGKTKITEITANIYDGAWHHVVWVCDPATAGADAIYVDNALASTVWGVLQTPFGTTANLGFPMMIGGRNNRGSADQTITASLDEVALYTSKLSGTRVAAHYAAAT